MNTNKSILAILAFFVISYSQECVTCQFIAKPDSEVPDHDSALCINDTEVIMNKKYLDKLVIYDNGFANWTCGKYKNVFINKNGRVVLWGVAYIDNGPDYFNNGIVRITRKNKWGYGNKEGKLIVKPIYDGALPFDNGKGKACIGCVDKCVEGSNCEYHYFSGGNWFEIDTLGNIKKSKFKK